MEVVSSGNKVSTRRVLCEAGHVVIATAYYPPNVSGSSVLMGNLLKGFDPASYTVATAEPDFKHSISSVGSETRTIVRSTSVSRRVNKWWRNLQLPRAKRRLIDLIHEKDACVVVGVYPDIPFLKIAQEAAAETGVPFIAYLHDTLAEAWSGTPTASEALVVQNKVFSSAARILVMSQGMGDLYRDKYQLESVALEHTYPEEIDDEAFKNNDSVRQAFWAGSVYHINNQSVIRIIEALRCVDCELILATPQSEGQLRQEGVAGAHLKFTFFSEREVYLEALRRQGLLVLALSWPDESPVHQEELGTIFPTKTAEYLASGRPILVHCPEEYFLAKFFREHACGYVVSDRSVVVLEKAVVELLSNSTEVQEMRKRALKAVRLFSAERTRSLFHQEIQAVVDATKSSAATR